MVASRGDVFWLDLGAASSSAPAKRRPVVVIQAQPFNDSAIATVIVAALSSKTAAASYPGNVYLPAASVGLRKDSVVKVTEISTRDRSELGERIGRLPDYLLEEVDRGLRLVLSL